MQDGRHQASLQQQAAPLLSMLLCLLKSKKKPFYELLLSSQNGQLIIYFTFSFRRLAVSSQLTSRLSPFPKFDWADPEEVWSSLCRKDRLYKRNHDYILAHPSLQPRMRAILLDWLVEVSFEFFSNLSKEQF